jgi:CHAT domain-containing protein/Flp pilus assembly protein TadD
MAYTEKSMNFLFTNQSQKRTYEKSFFGLRPLLVFVFVLINSLPARTQELLDLVGWGAQQAVGEEGARLKLRIDSIDFQFAMSVSENAGFFDTQNKGEASANFLADFKSANMKSFVERARDTLEFGLGQYGIRRYKMAERSFRNAQKMIEQEGRTDHILYLRVISSLGLAYIVQGRWQEAEKYITFSLQRSEKDLGKKSAAYIANLNNRAKLDQALGKPNLAEQEFNECRKLSESFFGGSMQTAIIINNQAMLAQALGRTEQAVKLMNEAINNASAARKKIIEGQSFDNRRFQLNLGTLFLAQGKFADAEKVFLEIKKGAESRGQTKNQEYGTLLNLLGVLYVQMGKNDKVEEVLLKSAEVFRKRFNDVNYLSAKVLNDLGNFYRLTGKYDDAEKKLKDALSMRQTLFIGNHPDVVKTQEDLAILYWKTGKPDKAYGLYKEVMDKTVNFIFEYFPPMSETEKSKFWNIQEPRFQRFFNFSLEVREKIPSCLNDFYEYHLITKGILIGATSKVKNLIMSSNDQNLQRDYMEWIDLREQLAEAYGYSKNKLKAQNIDIGQLEQNANSLEKSLSARSAGFAKEFAPQRVTTRQIGEVLKANEGVVDIVRVRNFNQDFVDGSRYVVFILKKQSTTPKLVILENGNDMEGRYFNFYRNTIMKNLTETIPYQTYWSAINNEVKGIQELNVSLDGAYNQINLNTLMDESGKFVIDQYNIRLIGNVKDLVNRTQKTQAVSKTNATLIGFPNYDGQFSPLPGTKIELENISKILRSKGFNITAYVQNDATEKRIKSVKNPSVLHIASHGYFSPDTQSTNNSFGTSSEGVLNNPLLRSGLILTGAVKETIGAQDISSSDNGYLTAFEVTNLSLDDTGLVILSACQTGLGDIKNGEGVYGLQRAFLIAGSHIIIMSLWTVDDAATQELMVNFYNNWTTLNNFSEAFKSAQLQLKQKYPEPYFWGAFVMIGD